MEHFVTEAQRDIYWLDDAFSMAFRSHMYLFCSRSFYTMGFQDNDDHPMGKRQAYMCASFSEEDLANSGFLTELAKTDIAPLLNGYLVHRTLVNLSKPTDIHFPHTHGGFLVLLYYINTVWEHHWYGETMFYNDQLNKIELALPYTPGRLLVFDGNTPHTLRPHSIACPDTRMTLAVTLKKDA